MKTQVIILLLCLHLALLTACSPSIDQARSKTNTKNHQNEYEGNFQSTILETWKKAVIHLEGATDSKSLEDRSKLLEQRRQDINGSRDIRERGTAIFLKHENRRYLITARHILHDSIAAARYLKQEERTLNTLPLNRRESHWSSAKNEADKMIYSVIFRIPSLQRFPLG